MFNEPEVVDTCYYCETPVYHGDSWTEVILYSTPDKPVESRIAHTHCRAEYIQALREEKESLNNT